MKRLAVVVVMCVGILAGHLWADIKNRETGETIPGTEGITPGPNLSLNYWNTSSKNLNWADFSGELDLSNSYFEGSWLEYSYFERANLTGANFGHSTLTNATLANANLSGGEFYGTNFTNANLSNANLTGACLESSGLTNTNLTDATIKGVDFNFATEEGLTASQLYSTASYKNKDLSRINFGYNDLSGWDFSGQNLTGAEFYYCNLMNANLTDATIKDTFAITITASQLYSTASYKNKDLSGVTFWIDVSGWDFSGQNLTGANFQGSKLMNANLTDATIKGAGFENTTSKGFTASQLYSTASYKNKDLSGIYLISNNLSGWDFSGQNLTGAYLYSATLTGVNLSNANLTDAYVFSSNLRNANLTDATIKGADFRNTTSKGFTASQLYSTASYKNKDLSGVKLGDNDLSNWDFSEQNLTGAYLSSATLTGANLSNANLTGADFYISNLTNANLTDATVKGADFGNTTSKGFTSSQLYSTASYKNKDLSRIDLGYNYLSNWDFSGQNLTGADFYFSDLKNANLSNSNLMDAYLTSASLTNADLSGADTRGAIGINWSGAITRNTIRENGDILGLDLWGKETLKVHDYDGGIGITVTNYMQLADDAVLHIILTDATWGSTITLDPGIELVELGGILNLDFAAGADAAALVGTTFDLFNWNGMLVSGDSFNEVVSRAGYQWDLSQLYTTGEVTLLSIPEPATMLLLAAGGMLLRNRRK